MSSTNCAVYCCNNNNLMLSKSFYRFPKGFELCKQWISAAQRDDLMKILEQEGTARLYTSHRICSDHFEESYIKNTELLSCGLKKGAVPTLKLYDLDELVQQIKSKGTVRPEPAISFYFESVPVISEEAATADLCDSFNELSNQGTLVASNSLDDPLETRIEQKQSLKIKDECAKRVMQLEFELYKTKLMLNSVKAKLATSTHENRKLRRRLKVWSEKNKVNKSSKFGRTTKVEKTSQSKSETSLPHNLR